MKARMDPLKAAWAHKIGHVFIAHKRPGSNAWLEHPKRYPTGLGEVERVVREYDAAGHDVYFTPGVYSAPLHTANRLTTDNVLWADLDEGYDRDRLANIPPTYLWRTSENCRQALWLLPTPPAGTFNVYGSGGINHALSTYLGADPSGWNAGKFLRVPGTTNNKRGEPWRNNRSPRVGHEYKWDEVFEVLGAPETFSYRAERPAARRGTPASSVPVSTLYERVRSLNVWHAIMRFDPEGAYNRSNRRWQLLARLFEESDLTPDEVLALVSAPTCPLYQMHGDPYTEVWKMADQKGRP